LKRIKLREVERMCFDKLFKALKKAQEESEEQLWPQDYPKFEITWGELKRNLEELGLECMLKAKFVPDTKVTYTTEEAWGKMVSFLTYPADYYVAELEIDCDDYSKWTAADASKKFKLSGCLQCWGNMPLGYHAFSLVVTGPKSYKLFEPNAGFGCAGELFASGDFGYQPKSWK